jgi:twitching motility two-component system response regulator PilG
VRCMSSEFELWMYRTRDAGRCPQALLLDMLPENGLAKGDEKLNQTVEVLCLTVLIEESAMLHKVSFRSTVAGSDLLGEQVVPATQNRAHIHYTNGQAALPQQGALSHALFPPPSQQGIQPALSPASPLSAQPAQHRLILVIDDSATVRKIIETCLGREGFEVIGFEDGIEAMRWLGQPSARVPDLVFLDIGLPKMDGYEVARRLKSKPEFARTVFVILSRRDGVLDRLKGRLAGAREYMTKPFKTQDIIALVESYLGVPAA